MENLEKGVFEEYNEGSSNLSIEDISGLGDSNYENEDFMSFVPADLGDFSSQDDIDNNENVSIEENIDISSLSNSPVFQPLIEQDISTMDMNNDVPKINQELENIELPTGNEFTNYEQNNDSEIKEEEKIVQPVIEIKEDEGSIDIPKIEIEEDLEENNKPVSDAEKVDTSNLTVDIDSLFLKINDNVKEASDIFLKNAEIKKRIDDRFNELKDLQSNIEKSKKEDYEEINSYKESVIKELTDKKNEVEQKINELKDAQAKLEADKRAFEIYKQEENTRIRDEERQRKTGYEERKEELEQLEIKIRKQKDAIEEGKRQLSLDRIQYESDKNELANNLLKFNELVGTFTTGMDAFTEDKK